MHVFTVQTLLFDFDNLMWLGPYKPVVHDGGFWIGDDNGERLTNVHGPARALRSIGASGRWG